MNREGLVCQMHDSLGTRSATIAESDTHVRRNLHVFVQIVGRKPLEDEIIVSF